MVNMFQDSHASEEARLTALHRYQVLDTEPEAAFERLASLAKRIFRVPTVLISFVAEDRQWFKACIGFDNRETDLASSFCKYTIQQNEVMVVLDAPQDLRFRNTPLVTGEPFIRFYAGAPLQTPEGYNIGSICLIDTAPHSEFAEEARATLMDLAGMVVNELEFRLARENAERNAERAKVISESITEAFYTLDDDWRFTYLNPAAEGVLRRRGEDLLGRELWLEFPETKSSILYQQYSEAVTTGETRIFEYYYPPLLTHFETHAYPSKEGLSVFFQDINARKESEQKARIQAEFRRGLLLFTQEVLQQELDESFYQNLLELALGSIPGAQAGSLVVNKLGAYHFVAAVGYDLAGLRDCTLSVADLQFDASTPDPKLVYAWDIDALSESQKEMFESNGLVHRMQVSLCLPILVNAQPLVILYLDNFDRRDAFNPDAIEMASVLAQQAAILLQRLELEVALRREQQQLEHSALYDSLTGLPNRWLFDDRLEQAAAHARRSGNSFAIMFLDLDNFKDINDTHGHALGDLLIQAVAARLLSGLREGDTLARWGGDEFVFIIAIPTATDTIGSVAERLLEGLQRPFELSGVNLRTRASIGIALYNDGAITAEDVVKNADIALYQAKEERNCYHFFDDSMRAKLQVRVELGEELRVALQTDALEVHFQPRVKLTTGETVSLEALARWRHPTKGWVSPSVFIPLAEELGLIGELGTQILDKACAQANLWQKQGMTYRIAVNLSVNQLKRPNIVNEVQKILDRNQLDPILLELEITESTAMADVEQSIEKLHAFRGMGIHLAIDDFGTAYSSLAYLRRLPVQTLKIDQSFIKDIGESDAPEGDDIRIIEAILALAKSLGLYVIAEGIETDRQRRVLQKLGCEEAQGYLFAEPLPANEVETLLVHNLLIQG